MRYVHAVAFFVKDSLRIRRKFKASWVTYILAFPGMLWDFLVLEWNLDRDAEGFGPIALKRERAIAKFYSTNSNPRKGGRNKAKKAKKKGKK